MPPMTGTFKLIKSENFDEYMSALGVGFVLRKLAATATPITIISQNGDNWNIKTETTFKTTEIKFQLGKEFKEVTADGRTCKSTIDKQGDSTLVHTQNCSGQILRIFREFYRDEMKMVLEGPQNIVSTRIYKKQSNS